MEADYRQVEMKRNGMQVIMKFPKDSKNEKDIRREAKELLFHIFQEYLAEIP